MINIFAIGDLHLSGFPPKKPMDIFGEGWSNHWEKISESWRESVNECDTVLIPGDISWAMSLEEAQEDILAIDELPGQKIFLKGNHDFWWSTSAKLRAVLPKSISFIHNSYVAVEDIAICGSRGWVNPSDSHFTEQDAKIYEREINRIAASINAAKKDGYSRIFLATHYPMIYYGDINGDFANMLAENAVEHYIYGHLHGPAIPLGPVGAFHNVSYHLVSCDALNFQVTKIAQVHG